MGTRRGSLSARARARIKERRIDTGSLGAGCLDFGAALLDSPERVGGVERGPSEDTGESVCESVESERESQS